MTIRIKPMFWLFAALIGYFSSGTLVGTLVWIAVVLVSVLVHEFGHALTALAYKQKAHIQLVFFGGSTRREGPPISLPKEFLLTLNGPLFGLALFLLSYGALFYFQPEGVLGYALLVSSWVNAFWSIINLLPILPMDGGHLMRIILEGIFGAKGTSYAMFASLIIGGGLAIAGFAMGYFLVGAIFGLFAFESFRSWKVMRDINEADQDEDLKTLYQQASRMGDLDESLAIFEEIRSRAGKGLLFAAATEGAAQILAQKGDTRTAYDYLKSLGKRLSPPLLPLIHELAYENEDFEYATHIGKEVYQVDPTYEVAYINALSHAALGQAKPAIGWIKCAIRDGLPRLKERLQSAEFDRIRNDPAFEKLTQ